VPQPRDQRGDAADQHGQQAHVRPAEVRGHADAPEYRDQAGTEHHCPDDVDRAAGTDRRLRDERSGSRTPSIAVFSTNLRAAGITVPSQ
jgi:hypothetical protein